MRYTIHPTPPDGKHCHNCRNSTGVFCLHPHRPYGHRKQKAWHKRNTPNKCWEPRPKEAQ